MSKLYRQLYEEFLATDEIDKPSLWALTPEEVMQTNQLNLAHHNTSNDITIALKAVLDYDLPFDDADFLTGRDSLDLKSKRVLKTKDLVKIRDLVCEYLRRPSISVAAFNHAFERCQREWVSLWMNEREPKHGGRTQISKNHLIYITEEGKVYMEKYRASTKKTEHHLVGWALPVRLDAPDTPEPSFEDFALEETADSVQ